MAEQRVWHNLRPTKSSRQPRTHVFVDSEAYRNAKNGVERQTWRCAAAIFHSREKGRPESRELRMYDDARQLWSDVSGYVPRNGRCIVWCHNLAYDVRITRAIIYLSELGWRVVSHNLIAGAGWVYLRNGDRTITLCDSVSHLYTTIRQLSKSFSANYVPLPSDSDGAGKWMARCVHDVTVLHDAIMAYIDKLDSLDLGELRLTGPAQAFMAFRKRFMTHRILVHAVDDALDLEREAMWTGRVEAYRHGRLKGQVTENWDMTLAYPRIAYTHKVPVAVAGPIASEGQLRRIVASERHLALAKVRVDTDKPLVPARLDERICWPVGTFETVLWEPELKLLDAYGVRYEFVSGWFYHAQPALRQWAAWIFAEFAKAQRDGEGWWLTILHQWARSVIGRFAMTYQSWEYVARSEARDMGSSQYEDLDAGTSGHLVQLGNEIFLSQDRVLGKDTVPSITGYIMSAGRAELTDLWQTLGEDKVIYMDTDSMMVSAAHHDAVLALAQERPDLGLRVKGSWRRVTIHGPRQLTLDGQVKASGIPVGARSTPSGQIVGEVWESLYTAMLRGHRDSVVVYPRRWSLRSVDPRRVATPDGMTVPIRLRDGVRVDDDDEVGSP